MSVVANELDGGGSTGGRMAWSGGEKKETRISAAESFKINKERASKGCWSTFSKCVGGMWATRQMTKTDDDREVYVRTTLRELVIYLIFLTILCTVTIGMSSSSMYYYTKALGDLFLDSPDPKTRNTFRESNQLTDFWEVLDVVFLDVMYQENWYNPEQTPTLKDDRNILFENRMLGTARMRQVRVRNDSCLIPANFRRTIKKCYGEYQKNREDHEPFGDYENSSYPTAWVYHSEEVLGAPNYWGKLATYSGGGYFVDYAQTKAETKAMVKDLKDKLWVDRGTRAVFIDFTVYNANINLFCVTKFAIEFPAIGGMIPSWSFKTVKLLRYVTPFDYFMLACEFIFLFFIVYYIVEETLEIANIKLEYFTSLWNILDLTVIGLSVLCIGFNFYCVLTVGNKLHKLLSDPTVFSDFDELGILQIQFNSAVAICVFFAWFKLFKYLSFNKTMTQLFSTLSRCAKDVFGFSIMFFIVFFAFSMLGYMLFGTMVKDYSSFISSVFTLLRMILGDFNFYDMQDADRILGPLYFLCYIFFVFFVLLNMFLAIINDTYSEVKGEIAKQRNEFEIADYFKRGYNNLMGKFGRRDKLIDIENALKLADTNGDGTLTFEEVRTNLKKCNFSDMEIEMFFARYDVDGDRLLEAEDVKKMLSDLQGARHDIEHQVRIQQPPSADRPTSAGIMEERPRSGRQRFGEIFQDEFNVLIRRIDNMELSIGSIVTKIEVVLAKLDFIEKNRSKRKEHMGKMLDDIIDDEDEHPQSPPEQKQD